MESKAEKEATKKVTRRDALKRIALVAGSIGLLGSLHSWATTKSGVGLRDINQQEQQRVAAYYSYNAYSSFRTYTSTKSYYSYNAYSSTSKYTSLAYTSLAPSQSRGGGCTRSD